MNGTICCVQQFWKKTTTYCKDVKLHFHKTEYNIPDVLCGKEGEVVNNTFGMLQSLGEKPTITYLANVTVLTADLDHKMLGRVLC